MNIYALVLKIYDIMTNEKNRIEFEDKNYKVYKMLDITYKIPKDSEIGSILSTEHVILKAIAGERQFSKEYVFEKGDKKLLYRILDRLEKEQEKIAKEREKKLNGKTIELNGIIKTEDNGDGYGHAEWEDVDDKKLDINLQTFLEYHNGKKVKIQITVED